MAERLDCPHCKGRLSLDQEGNYGEVFIRCTGTCGTLFVIDPYLEEDGGDLDEDDEDEEEA